MSLFSLTFVPISEMLGLAGMLLVHIGMMPDAGGL